MLAFLPFLAVHNVNELLVSVWYICDITGRGAIEKSVLVPMLSEVLLEVISPLIKSMFVGKYVWQATACAITTNWFVLKQIVVSKIYITEPSALI